jgi:hypothetical protein
MEGAFFLEEINCLTSNIKIIQIAKNIKELESNIPKKRDDLIYYSGNIVGE